MSIEKDLIIQTGKTKRIDSEDNVKFTLEESGAFQVAGQKGM